MPLTRIPAGIDLFYDTFGDPGDPPLVLIMGLATQMVAWPEDFCRMLAASGHFVVRFDNRDIGLSAKLEDRGVPDLERLMKEAASGQPVRPPYTLADMAADTLGLMDVLSIGRAHVCGLSMGGMIGQVLAMEHPERLLSLISMMSTTSEPDLPPSTPRAHRAMMAAPPSNREGYIAYMDGLGRAFFGDSDHYDPEVQRTIAAQAFDRGLYPWGFLRQMAAIVAGGGRRARLKTVRTPTLIIHGDCDTVTPPAHGQDTAAAIPGARLVMIPGLGHGLACPGLWERIVSAIADHTFRVAAIRD